MIIEHMRTFLVLAVLVGCGGNDLAHDAAPPDAVATLDCSTYCDRIQASCTGENAQYSDRQQCLASCASFPVGTSTIDDTSGHTLGCRIYHAGAASMGPNIHCAHAGPGGDRLTASPAGACSGGDVCTSFCTLQIAACGTLDAPLPGNPTDSTGNRLFQYQNMADCVRVCGAFDKTRPYRTTSAGDSLACRLLHATRAALDLDSAKAECRYSGMVAQGPCAGVPTP